MRHWSWLALLVGCVSADRGDSPSETDTSYDSTETGDSTDTSDSMDTSDDTDVAPETQVSCGSDFSCSLREGAVRCWGGGLYGELGYGNTENIGDNETPSSAGDVNIGEYVTQISAGGYHACALVEGGDVYCWGDGFHGTLGYADQEHIGDDESPASAGPVDLGGIAVQITSGYLHTCALLDTGAVRCWGYGGTGLLGYGNTDDVGDDEVPAAAGDVDLGDQAIQVAAGGTFTCALLQGGDVRCWGENWAGQLGYGNEENIGDDETPAAPTNAVDLGADAVAISLGRGHACFLTTTSAVRCWGLNNDGQLGYGNLSNIGDNELPSAAGEVNVNAEVIAVNAGGVVYSHTCAVLSDGSLRCWGANVDGQLGYGHTVPIGDSESPGNSDPVDLDGDAVQVSAGGSHTCAVRADQSIFCWGYNRLGQLGYGNTSSVGDNETPASVGPVHVWE